MNDSFWDLSLQRHIGEKLIDDLVPQRHDEIRFSSPLEMGSYQALKLNKTNGKMITEVTSYLSSNVSSYLP